MIEVSYKKQLKHFCLDVSFKMPDRGISVLFGPSGSGKTTLLNLIAGFNEEPYEQARFALNGSIYDDAEQALSLKPWQRNIAYVFQDNRLFPHMTVQQNIDFGYERRNSQIDQDEIIRKFKIDKLLQHYPGQLSGGQKQRVAMVRALLSNPELLILDEPLAALDYQSRQELLPYIESIHQELTIPVIYVSHDIREVLRLADYIVVINQGRVIDQGNIEDLCISQPLLTQAEGASFILSGQVEKIHAEDKLIEVMCGNVPILITAEDLQAGDEIRMLIHAQDVSLCLTKPRDSSILNCVPVVINSLQQGANGKLQVHGMIGEQKLVAMISHRSAKHLEIEPGKELYAQFKATAMIK